MEVHFYLRRKATGRDILLPRGALTFYIFLYLDSSSQNRNRWAVASSQLNFQPGQMIYCAGGIFGQIKQKDVVKASFQKGTPVAESPIFLIIPTVNLRPANPNTARPTLDASSSSKPAKSYVDFNYIFILISHLVGRGDITVSHSAASCTSCCCGGRHLPL
ncbi:hypothetical protein F5Y00DRAFT_13104 [Daldinia vernicosa]|uniref:uncharacterized protein n=1 Tax=Daldinia vernicosa TaxID=114800 RepID=UPI002007E924|nr:uncharacterized protein F5Y00DRAFT_13104 [Daldinia vernicosa]KAI0851582.1 hypothetical protein F5Y00DRAFT_13104 [Daldinia vernicosa]